jgi:hypothetical protein
MVMMSRTMAMMSRTMVMMSRRDQGAWEAAYVQIQE